MAERVSNMKFTKETARRAFRTCLQVAAGTIAANLALIDWNSPPDVLRHTLIGLLATAIATGIAAVMNLEPSDPEPEEEQNPTEKLIDTDAMKALMGDNIPEGGEEE